MMQLQPVLQQLQQQIVTSNNVGHKVSAVELLDMLMIGLRNLLSGVTQSNIDQESTNPLDQPLYISTVADHLWREHDARVEKKKQHRKKQQQQIQIHYSIVHTFPRFFVSPDSPSPKLPRSFLVSTDNVCTRNPTRCLKPHLR